MLSQHYADYKNLTKRMFGESKILPRKTFNYWKKTGHKYLDYENSSVNCRLLEVEEEIEKEDEDLMKIEEIAGPSNSSSTPKEKTTQS